MSPEAHHSTRELLGRVRHHWKDGWAGLVRQCDTNLRVLLHFRLRGREDHRIEPDDIMQEVWATAMRCFDKFEYRGPGSFYAWLVGILRHKTYHARRKAPLPRRASPVERDRPGELLDAIVETQAGVATQAADRELADHAKALLEDLPEHLRQVVLLRIYEALPGREVAEILGVSESTVSKRLKRALGHCSRLVSRSSRAPLERARDVDATLRFARAGGRS